MPCNRHDVLYIGCEMNCRLNMLIKFLVSSLQLPYVSVIYILRIWFLSSICLNIQTAKFQGSPLNALLCHTRNDTIKRL